MTSFNPSTEAGGGFPTSVGDTRSSKLNVVRREVDLRGPKHKRNPVNVNLDGKFEQNTVKYDFEQMEN